MCGGLGSPWWAAKIDHGEVVTSSYFCGEPGYADASNFVCFYTTNASSVSAGGVTAMAYTSNRKILLGGYVTFTDGSIDFQVQRLLGDEMFFSGFGVPSTNFN